MCGCNKGNSNRSSGQAGIRRNLVPSTANQPRAINAQSTPLNRLNASGISAERRKTQAIRRNAIRNALNK